MKLELDEYLKYHSPGYVIDIYSDGSEEEIIIGNKCVIPKIKKTSSNTLYDIASLTKVYTSTLVYIAYEEKKIDINEYVYNIDSNFVNLKNIKIIDLLSHNQNIWTNGYLGSAKSKDEFYQILYTAYVKENIPTYVDTHYIILSTLLEKVYNLDFKKIIEKKILNKLNLKHTTFDPNPDLTASNNFENTDDKIIDNIYPGLIHDTKGRVAKELGITTGHASIFTTAADLLEFLKSFFTHSLLKKETIDLMLKHRNTNIDNYNILKEYSDSNDINIMYKDALKINPKIILPKTYNNMGTRYKNDIKAINDLPERCSNNSITFSGFTGPMFVIDFENKIIVVIMCNVMHNTKINRSKRKDITVFIMNTIFNNLIKG